MRPRLRRSVTPGQLTMFRDTGSADGPAGRPPIFQIGLFRSGTTLAWQVMRQLPGYRCYCEPLHEHLLERVSDVAHPAIDPRHTGVREYWSEYRQLDPTELHRRWAPWFGRSRFSLAPDEEAPDLLAFLRLLTSCAPDRAVLKFTRAGLRAGWLRANFPEATIIHVTRSPRDIWTSAVGRDSGRDDLSIDSSRRYGTFVEYYEMMAADVGIDLPGHPYRRFYALWLLTEREVGDVADDVWRYEDLVEDYGRWAEVHLVQRGLSPRAPSVPITSASIGAQFHPPEWYEREEAEVRSLLSAYQSAG